MDLDDGDKSFPFQEIMTNSNGVSTDFWSNLLNTLTTTSLLGIGFGDVLVLLAAVAYTFHVVRLSEYAQTTTPLKLASSKATVEAFLSIALVLTLLNIPADIPLPSISTFGQEIAQFFSDYSYDTIPTTALLACLWTGWVTCAYTIYAQSFGQKRVRNPTFANLIYTMQPLFSAGFAWWLLGETLGPWGFAGGSLIVFAVALSTVTETAIEEVKEVEEILQ